MQMCMRALAHYAMHAGEALAIANIQKNITAGKDAASANQLLSYRGARL